MRAILELPHFTQLTRSGMKKFAPVLFCLALWSLTGCSEKVREIVDEIQSRGNSGSGGAYNYEQSAVKFDEAVTYHNGYLDFSYTVPKGWWLYERNEYNFSEDREETSDPGGLDISYGDDSGYIELISFGNLQYSSLDNHFGFDINAEFLEGAGTIEQYMEYFEAFMLEPTEDASYGMINSGRVDINGVVYERRTFEVIRDGESNYNILTLTRPVREGYFLTIMVSYWPSNKNAETAIINAVAKGA
jgi:hypothetical protein